MQNNFSGKSALAANPSASPANATRSPEECAVTLYQQIMGLGRQNAEYAYMLVEVNLASARRQDSGPWRPSNTAVL